jgi:drug/metabolite transporter (DMT)-like permease
MEIIYSLFASATFSISHISIKQGVERLGVKLGTSIMLISGMVTTVIISLIYPGLQIISNVEITPILYFSLAGIIHFIGGWSFMNASSQRIGPARFGAMISTTPMFAATLAYLILDEKINFFVSIGIALITLGIFLTATSKTI